MLAFDGGGPAAEDVRELVAELEARGAPVARLASAAATPGCRRRSRSSRPTVRAQQLALALALARGLDPDAPAGLTKVTPTH